MNNVKKFCTKLSQPQYTSYLPNLIYKKSNLQQISSKTQKQYVTQTTSKIPNSTNKITSTSPKSSTINIQY